MERRDDDGRLAVSQPAPASKTDPISTDGETELPRWPAIAFALVVLALSAYAMISGFQLGYWVTLGPGPGFFPFWIGALMAGGTVAWALPRITRASGGRSGAVRDASDETSPLGGSRLARWIDRYRIWVVVASLVLLAAVLNGLGFQMTMFLFLLLHLKVLGRGRWIMSLIIAAAGSFGVFHLFWDLLQVPLPRSMLIPLFVLGL